MAASSGDSVEVAMEFGQEFADEGSAKAKKLRHPVAVFFHMAFRGLALLAYLLCGWFSDSFIASFVVLLALMTMDFWTVKNVTGRLLAGLRWWNYIDDDGASHWIFESRKSSQQSLVSSTEARIFWLSLFATEIFWAIMLFAALFTFKFKWLLVVAVALALNGANLVGYLRCRFRSGQEAKAQASSFFGRQLFTSMLASQTSAAAPR